MLQQPAQYKHINSRTDSFKSLTPSRASGADQHLTHTPSASLLLLENQLQRKRCNYIIRRSERDALCQRCTHHTHNLSSQAMQKIKKKNGPLIHENLLLFTFLNLGYSNLKETLRFGNITGTLLLNEHSETF